MPQTIRTVTLKTGESVKIGECEISVSSRVELKITVPSGIKIRRVKRSVEKQPLRDLSGIT